MFDRFGTGKGSWLTRVGCTLAWVGAVFAGRLELVNANPVVVHPITLDQVSWDMAATGVVRDSEYGHLRMEFDPDLNTVMFANIVARRGLGGTDTWLVENMPVLDAGTLKGSPKETCQTIDLSDLGVTRGDNTIVGQAVYYTVAFSATPIGTMPTNDVAHSTLVGAQVYSFGGDKSVIPVTPGLTPPKGPNKPAWNGNIGLKAAWRGGMPNGEQGTDQCGPGALTNSMHWLEAEYPLNVWLGGQTWNDTLLKFKTYTNWGPGGIGQKDAIEGKLRFAQDAGKFFTPGLNVKYEADSGLTDLGASVTVGSQTANRHGAGGAPTFAWLLSELQDGEDVEVSIDWLNNAGTAKTGGHVASVVGAMTFGNKMFVWTNDDGNQDDKVGNPPIPPVNGGLRTNMLHQVTIENGGYMRFSGYNSNNRIKATYSESVEVKGGCLSPELTLVAAEVGANSTVTMSGTGFTASSTVNLVAVFVQSGQSAPLGSVPTSPTGNFGAQVLSLPYCPLSPYVIVGTDGGGCVAKVPVYQYCPTLSNWGLIAMAMLVLIAATVVIMRRRTAVA